MWIASAARCQEIDRKAITEYGVPAMVLMERAGLTVMEAVKKFLPDGGKISILCGKGNNGGDGLVVARHAQANGYDVECLIAAKERELSLDAATQLSVARAQGIQPIFVNDSSWAQALECLCCRDLIVDALLGTGVRGEVQGGTREAIRAMNCSGVPILAVDVPSGINVDTGEEFGESVWATHTVTFGLPKPYLFQGIGLEHAGTWSIADIGLPPALTKEPTDAFLIEGWWVRNLLPERLRSCHKGDNGHVLVVAGSQRMPGAALLVARAALRAGAGLVTLASTPFVCEIVACHLPEVIYLPLPEIDGVIHPEASRVLLDSQERFNSAVFGPGLSQHSAIPEMLAQTWKSWERPSCIDADALNAVSTGTPLPPAVSVLTPHPGEMSRLLHCSTAEIRADRFNTVRTACERFRKTVLLKGAYSIVGEDTQILAVNSTGNPGMAAAGMGDVLSGVIGKLLAQDLPSYDAAVCGMYWHGLAADMCAEEIGEIGFRASEVAEMLPKARSRINRMHQQAIS